MLIKFCYAVDFVLMMNYRLNQNSRIIMLIYFYLYISYIKNKFSLNKLPQKTFKLIFVAVTATYRLERSWRHTVIYLTILVSIPHI